MAKRRHGNDQELPFVALMDTMTNVVGVLTIVLVMIGISLASAVNRVFSALPPATPEQIQAAQAELDRLMALQAPDQEKLKSLAKPDASAARPDLAALDTELARLERTAKDKDIKVLDVDALAKEQARREAELKQKKQAMDQLLAEQQRLKGLLDATPAYTPPPPKVVRIPAGRPIPADAAIERILVTKHGPHWIDQEGAKAIFLNEFKSAAIRSCVASKVTRGKQSVSIYDHEKLVRYFEGRKLMFREFRLDVVFSSWTASPQLRLTPTAPSQTALPFTLRRFKMAPKTVVMFHVMGDGFESYLAARELCDTVGVPAGWEYAGAPEFHFVVREIETNRPKPPPAKPAATTGTEIKRPATKLD